MAVCVSSIELLGCAFVNQRICRQLNMIKLFKLVLDPMLIFMPHLSKTHHLSLVLKLIVRWRSNRLSGLIALSPASFFHCGLIVLCCNLWKFEEAKLRLVLVRSLKRREHICILLASDQGSSP